MKMEKGEIAANWKLQGEQIYYRLDKIELASIGEYLMHAPETDMRRQEDLVTFNRVGKENLRRVKRLWKVFNSAGLR